MAPRPAIAHLPVISDETAQCHKQLAMIGNGIPACMQTQQIRETADDMRHHHLCRGIAVGIHRSCIAADAVEKPVDLALRVMKAAGTCPAI